MEDVLSRCTFPVLSREITHKKQYFLIGSSSSLSENRARSLFSVKLLVFKERFRRESIGINRGFREDNHRDTGTGKGDARTCDVL